VADILHNDSMLISKATSRLYFLKQLRKASAPPEDMLLFYTSVIRSDLEYAAPVWHNSLTAEQKDSSENVQKRAFLIIYGERFANRTCSYHEFCREVGSLSLADRRENLSYIFF